MTLAYELAMRMPERCGEIISTQRSRIGNSDRQRQFDFISRAVVPDTLQLDALFDSLMEPENRRIEPWSATTLSYLNHPLQSERAVKYIRPALEELQEIQRTGDIFFPRNWVGALLGDYRSVEAKEELNSFLNDNHNYPPLLKNKILQAAHMLQRANE
jgi:aminopeptidase N